MLLNAFSACVTPAALLEKLVAYLYDMALYNPLSIIVSPTYLYLFLKHSRINLQTSLILKERGGVTDNEQNNREAKEKRTTRTIKRIS